MRLSDAYRTVRCSWQVSCTYGPNTELCQRVHSSDCETELLLETTPIAKWSNQAILAAMLYTARMLTITHQSYVKISKGFKDSSRSILCCPS